MKPFKAATLTYVLTMAILATVYLMYSVFHLLAPTEAQPFEGVDVLDQPIAEDTTDPNYLEIICAEFIAEGTQEPASQSALRTTSPTN